MMVGMAVVVLMTACSSDSSDTAPQPTLRELHLVLCQPNYIDVTPMSSRRALPANYVVFDQLNPQATDISNVKIRAYVTSTFENTDNPDFQGDFIYNGESSWSSKVPLNEGDYYIYGFMPAGETKKIAISRPSGKEYDKGAVLTTTTNLNGLSNSDLCTIVGIKGSKNHSTPIQEVGIQQGQFKLNAADDGENVYVLLDHLYAALQLDLKIANSYRQLRRVKLTKLEMQVSKSVGMTITLTPNENNETPIAVTYTFAEASNPWVTIYEGDEKELDPTDSQTFLSFVAPGADNTTFKLRTTYNVYDRYDNLIRQGCTAENQLTLPNEVTLSRGELFKFYLTVNPTYLYVLSDPDLDNPTITVN